MAGIVKTYGAVDMSSRVRTLYPYECPMKSTPGSRPPCMVVDLQLPWVNLCPFWYGARVLSGGMIAEVRSVGEVLQWMAHAEEDGRSWQTLCVRKESAETQVGARLRN